MDFWSCGALAVVGVGADGGSAEGFVGLTGAGCRSTLGFLAATLAMGGGRSFVDEVVVGGGTVDTKREPGG